MLFPWLVVLIILLLAVLALSGWQAQPDTWVPHTAVVVVLSLIQFVLAAWASAAAVLAVEAKVNEEEILLRRVLREALTLTPSIVWLGLLLALCLGLFVETLGRISISYLAAAACAFVYLGSKKWRPLSGLLVQV